MDEFRILVGGIVWETPAWKTKEKITRVADNSPPSSAEVK
jgi:hypothetical protein